jgi:type I restriction enzyme S subunit
VNVIQVPAVRASRSIRFTTIGAICDEFGGEVQTGPFGSQLHASDYSVEGTPVVMPQDMVDGRIVTDKIARVSQKHVARLPQHRLQAGDIVYSRRGDVSRFAIVAEAESGWLCGTGSIRVRLKSPDFDIRYLRRFLQQDSVRSWLENEAKGVTMLNLNTSIIRNLPVTYPPIEEQRRIAAILDEADALRAKRRAALAQLDEMARAIFVEMFGRNRQRVSPSELVTVDAFADVLIGYPFSSASYTEDPNGLRLCRGANVLPERIDWNDLARWPKQDRGRFRQYELAEGDIVLAMDRPWISSGFKVARISAEDTPSLLVQRVARIRGTSPEDAAFLYALLSGDEFQNFCRPTETTVPHISPKEIRGFKFAPPPRDRLIEFARSISAVDALRRCSQLGMIRANALFASLQHRAFRGEL